MVLEPICSFRLGTSSRGSEGMKKGQTLKNDRSVQKSWGQVVHEHSEVTSAAIRTWNLILSIMGGISL